MRQVKAGVRQVKVLIKLFQKFAVGKAEPYGLKPAQPKKKSRAAPACARRAIGRGPGAEAPCLPPLSIANKKDTQAFGLDVLFSFSE